MTALWSASPADVANFYITIRTLKKRLDIARHNVQIQRESLQIAEARFEGGTTSQRDVEQAKTILAGTPATIPHPGHPTAPGQKRTQRPAGAAAQPPD